MQLAKFLASYVAKHSKEFIIAEKVNGTINKYQKVRWIGEIKAK